MTPARIHWSRSLGPLPDGAVLITRSSRWGNPFRVGVDGDLAQVLALHRAWLDSDEVRYVPTKGRSRRFDPAWCRAHLLELQGRDLACSCPAGQPCHGDELIRRTTETTA